MKAGERFPLEQSMTRWRGYSSLFTGDSSKWSAGGDPTSATGGQQQHQQQVYHFDDDNDRTTIKTNADVEMSQSVCGMQPCIRNNDGAISDPRPIHDTTLEEEDYCFVATVSSIKDPNDHLTLQSDSQEDNFLVLDIEDAIDRLGMGRFQNLIVLSCGLCFAADAMEILLLSFLAVILQAEWGLSEGQVDSIISVVFAGAMLGTLLLSSLGDWWGRRPVFALTAALISIFGVATAFCTTYQQVILVRFLVGFGVGGLTVPYDALSEFMPTSYRGTNLLSTSYFWTCGSLLVPFFAWLTLSSAGNGESTAGSWRAFVTLCALPCILSTVLGIFLVPESPRWLLTKGKGEKALRILRQAAAKNGRDPYLIFPPRTRLVDHAKVSEWSLSTAVASSIARDHEHSIEKAIPPGPMDHNQGKTKNACWIICSIPRWRKLSLYLSGQWYGLAFMYYGAIMAVSIVFSNTSKEDHGPNDADATDINASDTSSGDYAFDYSAILISSSAEVVGLTLAILSVDRFGRVSTQVWSYLLGGLCILILGLLDFYAGGNVKDEQLVISEVDGAVAASTEEEGQEQVGERRRLIFFAFLARMFLMAATSITWLHTSELLPTEIRATGHGLGTFTKLWFLSNG
jgi:MFS family permease